MSEHLSDHRVGVWDETRAKRAWQRYGRGLLLLVLLVQVAYTYLQEPPFDSDYGYQIGAAQALLHGHGLTIPYAFNADDLSTITRDPMSWWPPGYSFLAVPFYALTQDVWWTAMLLQLGAVLLTLVGWHLCIEALGEAVSYRWRWALWLAWLLLNPVALLATNLLTLGIFLWTMAALLRGLERESASLLLLAGLLMGANMLLRYTAWAIVPVGGLMVLAYAFLLRRWALLRLLLWYSLGLGIGLGVLALFNSNIGTTKVVTVLADYSERRLYWENLAQLVPFPIEALTLRIPTTLAVESLGLSYALRDGLLWAGSLPLMLAALVLGWQAWRSQWRAATPEGARLAAFWLAGAATTAAILAMLAYFSLTTTPLFQTWTFLEEYRYYAPTWVFIGIGALMLMSGRWQARRWAQRTLQIGVGAVLLASLSLGVVHRLTFLRYELGQSLVTGEAAIERPIFQAARALVKAGQLPVLLIEDSSSNGDALGDMALAGGAIYVGAQADFGTQAAQAVLVVVNRYPMDYSASHAELQDVIRRSGAQLQGNPRDFNELWVGILQP